MLVNTGSRANWFLSQRSLLVPSVSFDTLSIHSVMFYVAFLQRLAKKTCKLVGRLSCILCANQNTLIALKDASSEVYQRQIFAPILNDSGRNVPNICNATPEITRINIDHVLIELYESNNWKTLAKWSFVPLLLENLPQIYPDLGARWNLTNGTHAVSARSSYTNLFTFRRQIIFFEVEIHQTLKHSQT